MAQLLAEQHDLAVLHLSLDRTPSPDYPAGAAVLHLKIAGSEFPPLRVGCEVMNLPPDLETAGRRPFSEPKYLLPELVYDFLGGALVAVFARGEPLWLHLEAGCGLLPIVPWERLLQPRLGGVVLRLPYSAVTPFSETGGFTAVLCASTPPGNPTQTFRAASLADTVPAVARGLVALVRREPLILHVFCNEAIPPDLEQRLREEVGGDRRLAVVVHDPGDGLVEDAGRVKRSESQPFPTTWGAWSDWIHSALGGTSADAVHFYCHGALTSVQGVLSLAGAPTVSADAGLAAAAVGPQELIAFLTQIGAWSVGFTNPEPNYSAAGLRLLVDNVARLRPGSVILHDLGRDRDGGALSRAYAFLTGNGSPPAGEAIALYTHPERLGQAPVGDPDATLAGLERFVVPHGETRRLLEAEMPTPSWVAASQRFIEQTAATIVGDGDSPEQNAVREGTEDALAFITDLVEHHAGKAYAALTGEASTEIDTTDHVSGSGAAIRKEDGP